jgi:hypothetical protein
LAECLDSSQVQSKPTPVENDGKFVYNYCKHLEQADGEMCDALCDIIIGSIISLTLHSNSFDSTSKRFKDTTIYLDTNFLIELLGLSGEDREKHAEETLRLIKNEKKMKIKTFDFSIIEFRNLLLGYVSEYKIYPEGVRIDGIYCQLRGKGWTKSTVIEYLQTLDETLKQKGILIEHTGLSILKYVPKNTDLIDTISTYKGSEQGSWHRKHDIAALDLIAQKRKTSTKILEDCKYLFLTSDFHLCRFCHMEYGHAQNGTIPEAMHASLFTNILKAIYVLLKCA